MGNDTRTCPRCAEPVKAEARTCPHCRTDFNRLTPAGRRTIHPAIPWLLLLLVMAVITWGITATYYDAHRGADDQICKTIGNC